MKLSRFLLVGAVAAVLAGSVATAANATGLFRTTGTPTTAECPAPGDGSLKLEKVEVKDGKVFHNGEEVASVPPADKVQVAVKDGKVYVGEEAEAVAKSEAAAGAKSSGGGGVLDARSEDGSGPSTSCAFEPAPRK
ncbi:hypothetical protein IMZ11_13850 [Microtetraspora sp. AC03309]|uniref:hypothetical protein n=1 Tax=Microtetraspora sp. AC03309 TaxID=2779376 RepID=UPI001E2F8FD7|nr:hypothetical protein [Microtetraspora sp. AC03309]MCC5576716.1 hypothetical protein [Microtetraspora sp. AC03309]